jgi:uncharacterized low-complexity protein
MKNPITKQSALFAAMTLAGAIAVPLANAASNPFSNTELASGFNLDSAAGTKTGGEGKCGDASKCPEGKCGEGQCGEKCANKNAEGDNKATDDKAGEGKCGEGQCGANHKDDKNDKKDAADNNQV